MFCLLRGRDEMFFPDEVGGAVDRDDFLILKLVSTLFSFQTLPDGDSRTDSDGSWMGPPKKGSFAFVLD